jgi:hypothetical protein
MKTQHTNINDILVDDSKFAAKNYLFESFHAPTCHITSFDTLGILYPVIVYVDNAKRYHLVDGRKRVQFAKEMKELRIRTALLPENTPVTDIITLIFCNKRTDIESSVMNKIQFLCFAMGLNAPESWLLQTLCIPFEFKPHSSFLRECERINNLPKELRHFCHEKKFSFKQLLNLTFYPEELLLQIIKWKPSLQLTASIMDELASHLKDCLKRDHKTLKKFISENEVQDILDSSLSSRDKTEKLRHLIRLNRFPILSEKNGVIKKTVDDLPLPKGVQVNWDKTLENKNINISVNVSDPSKWSGILDTLSSDEVKKAIESILNEL